MYGLLLLVALIGCFMNNYNDGVQILCSGLIGVYTGNRLRGNDKQ